MINGLVRLRMRYDIYLLIAWYSSVPGCRHEQGNTTLSRLVGTQFQSIPLLPRPKNLPLAARGADLKNKNSRPERVQSVPSPPVDAQSLSSFVESSLLPAQFPARKPRLRRSVARGGACLRARASRLSIAAPPLLPKKRANRR